MLNFRLKNSQPAVSEWTYWLNHDKHHLFVRGYSLLFKTFGQRHVDWLLMQFKKTVQIICLDILDDAMWSVSELTFAQSIHFIPTI